MGIPSEMEHLELRRKLEALEEERARYKELYEQAPVGYVVVNRSGVIKEANREAARMVGEEPQGLRQQLLTNFVFSADLREYSAHCEELFGTGQAQSFDLRLVGRDGRFFWVQLAATLGTDAGGGPEMRVVLSDIGSRKEAEEALHASEVFQGAILNALPAHVVVLDKAGKIVAVDESWLKFARENGNPDEEKIGVGANYLEVCQPAIEMGDPYARAALAGVRAVLAGEAEGVSLVYPCDAPEQARWFAMDVVRLAEDIGGALVAHTDITEHKNAEELLAWEKQALALIASADSTHEVLDGLMLGFERQLPGAACALLLQDEDRLRRGSAPSLPEALIRTIEEQPIGAFVDKQVIVEDIAKDPLWADARQAALEHGVHACCCTPIRDNQGRVLGLFSVFCRQPHQPEPAELELIARAVDVIRIAIERMRLEEKVHRLNLDLERRVQERTAELRTTNAALLNFKAALDQHALVTIADTAGVIVYANDKICQMSKYSRQELIGKSHRLLNSGHHSREFFRNLWQTILRGEVWKGEIKNRAKDGTFYWVRTTIVPFLGEDGKPEQFISIRTDISELKQMEAALIERDERLRLAAEAAEIAVWEWDMKSDQLTWDARMFEIYGLPPSPQGHMKYSDWSTAVLPEDLPAQEAQLRHTIDTCGHGRREFRIQRASDRAVRVIRSAEMVIADGSRMVGVNFDATEIQQAEERIRQLNAALESRAAALEAANKELDAFSYSVSHDLRAPLRAIDGYSRMVMVDYADKLDDEGRRMLGVVRTEAQRMAQLINDLLEFSRLERQPLDSAPIDMEALAGEVFAELAALEPQRQIRFHLQRLPAATGSKTMIRQLWINLIGNALKFTKTREVAEIEIGANAGASGGYYVKDNGVGFDMRFADKLFGVFQRLHSQQEFPGTGVGLALVQRIVQRHGGRVWAEAQMNRGATIYFTL